MADRDNKHYTQQYYKRKCLSIETSNDDTTPYPTYLAITLTDHYGFALFKKAYSNADTIKWRTFNNNKKRTPKPAISSCSLAVWSREVCRPKRLSVSCVYRMSVYYRKHIIACVCSVKTHKNAVRIYVCIMYTCHYQHTTDDRKRSANAPMSRRRPNELATLATGHTLRPKMRRRPFV